MRYLSSAQSLILIAILQYSLILIRGNTPLTGTYPINSTKAHHIIECSAKILLYKKVLRNLIKAGTEPSQEVRNLLMGLLENAHQLLRIAPVTKVKVRDRSSRAPCSSCTTHSVHVLLDVLREVIIDHMTVKWNDYKFFNDITQFSQIQSNQSQSPSVKNKIGK